MYHTSLTFRLFLRRASAFSLLHYYSFVSFPFFSGLACLATAGTDTEVGSSVDCRTTGICQAAVFGCGTTGTDAGPTSQAAVLHQFFSFGS